MEEKYRQRYNERKGSEKDNDKKKAKQKTWRKGKKNMDGKMQVTLQRKKRFRIKKNRKRKKKSKQKHKKSQPAAHDDISEPKTHSEENITGTATKDIGKKR